MFNFFLWSYRRDILTFCGDDVKVEFDVNGPSGKEGFRLFEDGHYKNKPITSRHPNVLRGVIMGKKSWGLWVKEWTDGITEWSFTRDEILGQFDGVDMPESFVKDFDNVLERKRRLRNEKYLESLRNK